MFKQSLVETHVHDLPMQAKEENTTRRDELLRIQEEAQRTWADEKVFEVDAPSSGKIPGPSPCNCKSSVIQSKLSSRPTTFSDFGHLYTHSLMTSSGFSLIAEFLII